VSNTLIADDKPDWRLQTFTRLAKEWTSPWSGQVSPEGTRLTVVSVIQLTRKKQLTIPIPNATALMLNAAARAYGSAKLIRDQSAIDKSQKGEVGFATEASAFDYVEHMIESIILSFTALEAFANEVIPADYVYERHNRGKVVLEAVTKPVIERQIKIDEKLSTVLPEILNCNSPKGSRCWQGYVALKSVRDRVVHMKTEDRRSGTADIETVWKAIFLVGAPHLAVKALIDHFVKAMPAPPHWHANFRNGEQR
jgi:hypothetical protein